MEKIKLLIKRLTNDAILPTQAHDTDAGYDVYAASNGLYVYSKSKPELYLYTEFRTGIAVSPEFGYHLEIVPRSSLTNKNYLLKNSIGIIDNDYRGEICFRFYEPQVALFLSENYPTYEKGDKIGQIIIRKTIYANIEEVESLPDTQRGIGGFGSSDKQ